MGATGVHQRSTLTFASFPLSQRSSVRWFAAEYYQIPAGPNSNSLFGRINTLFACVGNFRFKHLETPKVPACDNARGRQFVEIPCRFPCLQGNLECWRESSGIMRVTQRSGVTLKKTVSQRSITSTSATAPPTRLDARKCAVRHHGRRRHLRRKEKIIWRRRESPSAPTPRSTIPRTATRPAAHCRSPTAPIAPISRCWATIWHRVLSWKATITAAPWWSPSPRKPALKRC